MKTKILAVCFCLFLTASMGMAASSDSIRLSGIGNGVDIDDILYAVENYLTDNFGAEGIGWDFTDFTYALDPIFPSLSSEYWDLESLWSDDENPYQWDFVLLYSDSTLNWYFFEDDYDYVSGLAGADGFLTMPDNIIDESFNMVAFYSVNQPEAVPEPGSLLLMGTGIVGLGIAVRRKMKK